MTTLREELDWIARPFSLAPPMPEEVFTECVDNLSLMIEEADLGSGDSPDFGGGAGKVDEPLKAAEEGGDEPERMGYGDTHKNQEPKEATALRQFIKWLNGMREQFPSASKKLGRLQDQIKTEMAKRPDKMFQAVAKWGKNTMLPQFDAQITKIKDRAVGEIKAIMSYSEKLTDILGL